MMMNAEEMKSNLDKFIEENGNLVIDIDEKTGEVNNKVFMKKLAELNE